MINGLKYLDRIKELNYVVARVNGELRDCRQTNCRECRNGEEENCHAAFIKWLLSESYRISKEEHAFLTSINPEAYLTREQSGELNLSDKCPRKHESLPCWSLESHIFIDNKLFPNVKFDFITWEDEKPWKVSDLLLLEIKTEEEV